MNAPLQYAPRQKCEKFKERPGRSLDQLRYVKPNLVHDEQSKSLNEVKVLQT